jgi:flagellar hook assembly protein FlgD
MYPNPTSDNTTLVFNLDEVSDVTVKIYNLSGSLVKTITKKNLEGGKQSLSLDSAEMPKGTYIVKMNAGQQNETAKFIKM